MVWWVTMEWFSNVRLRQILREENTRANKLSKLDPSDPRGSSGILVEYLERPNTQLELEILIINSLDWKSPIISCLKKGASLSMKGAHWLMKFCTRSHSFYCVYGAWVKMNQNMSWGRSMMGSMSNIWMGSHWFTKHSSRVFASWIWRKMPQN